LYPKSGASTTTARVANVKATTMLMTSSLISSYFEVNAGKKVVLSCEKHETWVLAWLVYLFVSQWLVGRYWVYNNVATGKYYCST